MAALSQASAEQAERAAAKPENITTNKPGEGTMTYNRDPESELLTHVSHHAPPNPQSKQHATCDCPNKVKGSRTAPVLRRE